MVAPMAHTRLPIISTQLPTLVFVNPQEHWATSDADTPNAPRDNDNDTLSEDVPNISQKPGPTDLSDGVTTP